MKPSIRGVAALAVAAMLAAAPAFAKDHDDKYDKHEYKHEKAKKHKHDRDDDREVRHGGYFKERDRDVVHRYYVEQYGGGARHCPPGLAKKHNGCMPPGQARTWAVGQPIPAGVTVYAVPQPVLVQLPPAPVGHSYSRVGADIVLKRGNLVVDVMFDAFN